MQRALHKTIDLQAGANAESLILFDVPEPPKIDINDEWSDEDLSDITRHSWNNADASLGEEPDAGRR